MTVIVGVNSFNEAIVISDSRVSWKDNQYPPRDILRKLYVISGSDNKAAVLGFAGLLKSASEVIRFLMVKKFQNYRRPLIMSRLRDDIGRWIEEVAKSELSIEERINVKFMLCGIESSRHPKIMKDGKEIGHMPFVETHVYTYSINKHGTVLCNVLPDEYSIIGSGKKLELNIIKKIQEAKFFGFNQPNLYWARAVVMGEVVATEISEDIEISKTVGGPFQVIRITPEGLESHYIWPPNDGERNVDVRHKKNITIVSHSSTGKKYILYPVWKLESGLLSGTG